MKVEVKVKVKVKVKRGGSGWWVPGEGEVRIREW